VTGYVWFAPGTQILPTPGTVSVTGNSWQMTFDLSTAPPFTELRMKVKIDGTPTEPATSQVVRFYIFPGMEFFQFLKRLAKSVERDVKCDE
jgi:hypothetical protein